MDTADSATAANDHSIARTVFAGLKPQIVEQDAPTARAHDRSRVAKGVFTTGSVLLVGSMAAMSLNLTGPVEPAEAKPQPKPRGATAELGKTIREAMAAANNAIKTTASKKTTIASAPATYTVASGDTISGIAGRYGLATASVLALNGLSWSSLIFPGQQLVLSSSGPVTEVAPAPAENGRYTIVAGDTISGIATAHGVSTLSILTANGLGWSSIIYPGQTLAIPGVVSTGEQDEQQLEVELVSDQKPVEQADPVVRDAVVSGVEPPADDSDEDAPADSTDDGKSDDAKSDDESDKPSTKNGEYTIRSGDTIGSIAAAFGISTQSLLDANGLSWSSVIYTGDTLVIPGKTTPASTGSGSGGSGSGGSGSGGSSGGSGSGDTSDFTTPLNDSQREHAETIIRVGYDLGVPDYGIVIALATAMQESSLRNLDWGDRDSVGLFQQRPSTGWGSVDDLTTPSYAARLFYGGPTNPNKGKTRGLLDISGWQSMSLTKAAQKVQISGHPDAYAKWETSAREWFAALG